MADGLANYIEERAFGDISVVNMYAVVQDARNTLGFRAPDDNQLIMAEAEYVTQQYRKFVETLKPGILKMAEEESPQSLINYLLERKRELDAYPKDVKLALYYTVRDTWLTQLINGIQYWMMNDGELTGGYDG